MKKNKPNCQYKEIKNRFNLGGMGAGRSVRSLPPPPTDIQKYKLQNTKK